MCGQFRRYIGDGLLEIVNPHYVDDGNEYAQCKGYDQDDLLSWRKSHTGKNWQRQRQDGEVRYDVDWRRTYEFRQQGNALRVRRIVVERSLHGTALKHVQQSQNSTRDVNNA